MARRRSSSGVRTITRTVRAPTPIIKVSAPRAPAKRRGRRRSGRSSSAGSLSPGGLIGVGVGALGLGLIEKHFPSLPTVPVLGRKGTITLLAYFAHKQMHIKIARDICVAGVATSLYEFGKEGRISGDDDDYGSDE